MDAETITMLAQAIQEATGITAEAAEQVARASEPLYRALGDHGLTDGFGGSESLRVLPIGVAAILMAANDLAWDAERRAPVLAALSA